MLFNFTENPRRITIALCSFILVYFPLSYSKEMMELKREKKLVMKISCLHNWNNQVMKRLEKCALEGLHCTNCDKQSLIFHPMIAWYAADLSEIKILLSVKCDNRTTMPCRTSEINRENLAGSTMAPKRRWFNEKYVLERRKIWQKEGKINHGYLEKCLCILSSLFLSSFRL